MQQKKKKAAEKPSKVPSQNESEAVPNADDQVNGKGHSKKIEEASADAVPEYKFQVMPDVCKSHKCWFQQLAQKKSFIPPSNTNMSISQSKMKPKFHQSSCAS